MTDAKARLLQMIADEPHMGGGGLLKAVTKAQKVAKKANTGARAILPAAEREANLAKMMESSKVKGRLYHGTTAHDDYADAQGQAFQQFTGQPTWLAKEPYTASGYSKGTGTVYPVHAQVKKPMTIGFDANDSASKAFPLAKRLGVDVNHMVSMRKPESAWEVVNDPAFVEAAMNAGHDAFLMNEGGYPTYGVFDPRKIKSAIGNRGTYDLSDPDITKAGGGLLKAIGKAQKVAKAAQPAKTATKIIEAPSIVIPSRLSNLKEVVRGQKGEYGAKRVERAADEIPNLERMYKEEAMRDAFLGENAKALVTMNPADFEKYALTLEKRTTIGPKMAELAKQGEIDKYTLPTDKYIQYLMSLQDGFEHMPYLDIFKDEVGLPMAPKVTGHEGRHRSRALAERGEPSSLVKINPRGDLREGLPRRSQEEYIDALRQELELKNRMIRPEDDTDFVQFPDVYAAGGAVHMAGGGRTPKYPWERYAQPKKVAEMRAREINPVAGAVKKAADYATQLIDKGPSFSSLVGNLVGAVPFVGPDFRKRLEASEISIPTDITMPSFSPEYMSEKGTPVYKQAGIEMGNIPTKDLMEVFKMSDFTPFAGLSNVAESIGYGQMPDALDLLDAAGVAALGYGALKGGYKAGSAAAGALSNLAKSDTGYKLAQKALEFTPAAQPMYAVKPKGGNWVDTGVKRQLDRLKNDEDYSPLLVNSSKRDLAEIEKNPSAYLNSAQQIELLRRDIAKMEETNAFNKWVDTKVGGYIRNQMGTPDDPVVKSIDMRAMKAQADLEAGQQRLAALDGRIAEAEKTAVTPDELNQLEGMKRNRSQRAAELQSNYDLTLDTMLPGGKSNEGYGYLRDSNSNPYLTPKRIEAGFPGEGLAQTRPGKAWEAATDANISINPAEMFQNSEAKMAALQAIEDEYKNYQNVVKDKFQDFVNSQPNLKDSTRRALINGSSTKHMAEMVGETERHEKLLDDVYQARRKVNNSSSDMANDNPYLAKLAPETPVYMPNGISSLDVDHVIDVLKQDVAAGNIKLEDLNKITMEQALKRMSEYDLDLAKKARDSLGASRAAMPVYKEYPEGYRWVQLTKPGEFRQESEEMGHSVKGYEPPKGHPDWSPTSENSGNESYGHGGWEAIKSGQAKVYSLVDANHKPHVTIEVRQNPADKGFGVNQMPKGNDFYTQNNIYIEGQRSGEISPDMSFAEWWRSTQGIAEPEPPPPIITQIKGKGNARPAAKYDQYTQDFVKSGNWGRVERDLKNTGLIESNGKYFTEPEFAEAAKKYGVMGAQDVPWEVARQRHIDAGIPEDEAFFNWVEGLREGRGRLDIPDEPRMAQGGAVSDAKQRLLDMIAEEPHMARGGEVHMGIGGVALNARKVAKAAEAAKKAAEAAAKAAKVDHPLVFPRAAAKTINDIRPIAQRMADQMTGNFVKQNPKVTTNPAGKSRKQFERERSIPLETRNVVPERPAPDVNYEDYMGYGLVGVPGDPTLGGVVKRGSLEQLTQPTVELTRVGNITPDYPVPLFGGPRYGDDEKFWASNFTAAVPIQKNASKLADKYESPILAKYIKMGSGSENFALHNLDALLSIQRPEKLDKAKMAQLTEAIQAGSPKYGKFPGFTGFKDPADVLLQAQMDSNLRKHIAETLTKPTITDQLGLPNGLDVVAAITYPELRNLETGASGFSVGKMKPGAELQRGQSSHPTYDTDIPGSFLGRSRYPTPYEIAFPDTTAYARSKMTPGVQEFNMMKMLGPRERIDQQYIDEIKMYEQLMKQYTGKKKGGLAHSKKVKRHGNTVSN
jgi:hypothetical protein